MAMNESEIVNLMPKTTPKADVSATNTITVATTRKLMLIGCGDGGCNIASETTALIPEEAYFIAYNTSTRGMPNTQAHKLVLTPSEDGAGKVRDFSKNLFKSSSHKALLDITGKVANEEGPFAYTLVESTTDGGTGSGTSPMAAKLIADNIDIPTLVMGVYPSSQEDPTAQFNALQWQAEINKIGVTYFVLDNDQYLPTGQPMSSIESHRVVNAYAARIASLLAGREFGNTNISMIDNRNLYMLLAHVTGRAVCAISTERPASNQSLDDYVDDMLHKCYQPLPSDCRGLGIFVKGPADMIAKMDTSLTGIQAKYGTAVIKFAHIEESEEIKIAVLMTGCSEAADRLTAIKNRYDDAMSAQKNRKSVVGDLMESATNPMGALATKKVSEQANLDALEL